MKRISTKAIILRRVNFEEADRILTVITPEHGKVGMFAKGVRRAKSKLAGGLELFSVSDIVFIEGRSDLKTVVSARLDAHFGDITKDINVTMLSYDFLKLVDEHTQGSCDEQFYYLLEHALASLNQADDVNLVKSWFFVLLLKLSGSSINIEKQIDGKAFAEDDAYNFDFDDMGFRASEHGQFQPRHIKFLRLLQKVDSPRNLLRVEGADEMAEDLVGLLEQSTKYN